MENGRSKELEEEKPAAGGGGAGGVPQHRTAISHEP